jgi:shikimate dehydrogenase
LDGAREISIFKRVNATFNTTVELADKIMSEQAGVTVNVYDISDDAKMVEEMLSADIFVNGTSVGMHPSEEDSIVRDMSGFHENLVVCDIVYNPLETKLLQDAASAGVKQCIGGKGMLLWQGVEAFKIYTGQNMPVNIVKKKLGLD